MKQAPLLSAIAATLAAAFVLLVGLPKRYDRETAGTIIDSQAVQIAQTDRRPARAEIRVRYKYRVSDRDFEGREIGETPPRFSPDDAGGIAAALGDFAVSKQVPVYYNESNPADAVLDASQPGARFFTIIFPVAAGACWVWWLVSVTRR